MTAASTIDFTLSDLAIPGDAFALFLNGVALTPTSGSLGAETRGPTVISYFTASFDDILLSIGTNVFTVVLTDSCCDVGGSYFTYEPVEAATVPLPASALLMFAGLGGLGLAARRKR